MRRGHLIHADTNVKEDRLGETLVRAGLPHAGGPEARRRASCSGTASGWASCCSELGILDKDRLEDALAIHLRENLMKVFSWNDGSYEFEEEPEGEEPSDVTLKLSTGEMILEAVRRVQDPDVVRYALGDIDRILGHSSDPLLRFQKITLSPADGYVLSRVDGTLSAREVLQLIPQSPEETQRSLFGLLCTGVIEYLPLPPKKPKPARGPGRRSPRGRRRRAAEGRPARAATRRRLRRRAGAAATTAPSERGAQRGRGSPPGDRGALTRASRPATTSRCWASPGPRARRRSRRPTSALAKRFHPDTHHDPPLADLRDKLEAVFIRLGEAYEVLRNPRSRASYESDLAAAHAAGARSRSEEPPRRRRPADPEAEAKAAEDSIQKAEQAHRSRRSSGTPSSCWRTPIPAAQSRMKQKGRVLLARAYLRNPNWVKQAEQVLLAATQEDPSVRGAVLRAGDDLQGERARAAARSPCSARPWS